MLDLYMLCVDLKNIRSEMRKKSNTIIQHIYKILNDPTEKTKSILNAWKQQFQYIYGNVDANLSSNGKLNIEELFLRYDITVPQKDCTEAIMLLFYSIQTYFSVLIKCMMNMVLNGEQKKQISSEELILGSFANKHGIRNYSNPDWYCWPVFELDYGFREVLNEIVASIESYQIKISLEDFARNNNYDYIKQVYEAIIPKELRHALGEYYTPDWLAEETLSRVSEFHNGERNLRFFDPTCGSGTFLFKTIMRKRREGCLLDDIVKTVYGVDINPLAVLTAKTNYLLSIVDLLDQKECIEIPVYNADIIRIDDTIRITEEWDFLKSGNPVNVVFCFMEADRKKTKVLKTADVIIGNPPWVNWEYMPEKYRRETQHLWQDYQLFYAKGRELSFSKEDISVLITYVVIDKFLKNGGILAFVIRQGVFKSAQNGVGFRRFRMKDSYGLRVLRVDDLSKIKVFDNATNSTALLYLKKGDETQYPVPYIFWKKRNDLEKFAFNAYSELREIKSQINQIEQLAMPAVEEDKTSIWITAEEMNLKQMKKMLGINEYRARTGVFTGGANAVYWLNILSSEEDEVQITNIIDRAKRKTEQITVRVEKKYIYPMLKGSNVKKWKTAYDTYLLCPHTAETKMWPVAQEELKKTYPKTYTYLEYFRDDLNKRKGFAGWEKEIQEKEFHAILRIGEYTFSKYKVAWKYIASEFVCAVISDVDDRFLGKKAVIPNEKIMYISTEDEMEAYYMCGILSSTLISDCVKSYMNPTSISAHVLNKLNLPRFDRDNPDHIAIAIACKRGHMQENISPFIREIDKIVEKMYS